MLYQMKATILPAMSTYSYPLYIPSANGWKFSKYILCLHTYVDVWILAIAILFFGQSFQYGRKLDLLQDKHTLADVLPCETGNLDHMPMSRQIQSK